MSTHTRHRWFGALSWLLAMSIAHATTCTLNSNLDDPNDAGAKVTAVPPGAWSGANAGVVTLRDCIIAANLMTGSTGAPSGAMSIDASAIAGQTITLQDNLPLLFNNATISAGSGAAVRIDGADAHRIFVISGLPAIPGGGTTEAYADDSQATTVLLTNLVLQHANAAGGSSGTGGGGMGAGAALFVNKAAAVTLVDVSFDSNAVTGGTSGLGGFDPSGQGGGGGMGGGAAPFCGGGGLNGPAIGNAGAGIGTPGTSTNPGGFGGTGTGSLSVSQAFTAAYFGVDSGAGTSGNGVILTGAGGRSAAGGYGGFGGGGGSDYEDYFAGNGGFGGGGGGVTNNGGQGGAGGFGGGGGGALFNYSGKGGFGGGGGGVRYSQPQVGGVGGGNGAALSGGGGAGLGGAVFVRNGGALTISSTSSGGIAHGSAVAGSGGNAGAAAGAGMFLMSGATTVFDIAGRYTIDDAIADDSVYTLPPGGTYQPGSGAGAVIVKQGSGTLVLSGVDSRGGTMQVNAGALAGTGTLLGDATLADGARIAPGDPAAAAGVGTLTMGSLTWNGGGSMDFQLGATAAASDRLDLSAGALAKGTAGSYIFHFGMGALPPQAGTVYTLIQSKYLNGFAATDFSFDFDGTYATLDGAFAINACGVGCFTLDFQVSSVTVERIFADGFD